MSKRRSADADRNRRLGEFQFDGSPTAIFAARVVIPTAEFTRLGLGDHERPGALPACFRWCHATFGVGGTRWGVSLPEDADAVVYFAEQLDAQAFFARWSPAAHGEQRLAA